MAKPSDGRLLFRDFRWNAKRGCLMATFLSSLVVVALLWSLTRLGRGSADRAISPQLGVLLVACVLVTFTGTVMLYRRSSVWATERGVLSCGPLFDRSFRAEDVTGLRRRQVYNGRYCVEVRTLTGRVRITALPWQERDRLYPLLPPAVEDTAGVDRIVRKGRHEWEIQVRQDGSGGWEVAAYRGVAWRGAQMKQGGLSKDAALALAEQWNERLLSGNRLA